MMQRPESDTSNSSQDVLEALGKSYVLDILDSIQGHARPANAIAREAEVPTTTLYRRLDLLVDVGLVGEQLEIAENGHHYTVYESQLNHVDLVRDDDGLQIDIDIGAAPDQHTTEASAITQ